MTAARPLGVALAAAALTVALAACGEKTIDADGVERFIRATPGLKVQMTAAECPSDVAVKQGGTFECTVSYENGSEESWTLEQLGGEGSVRTTHVLQTKLPDDPSEVEILPENVEALIANSATKPLEDVDCPADVKVEEGSTFTCTASFRDGTREKVSVLQRDALGNVEVTGSRPVD